MTEKTETETRYIALPDGLFRKVTGLSADLIMDGVERLDGGDWRPMGMYHTMEGRDRLHRLMERHMELTGRDVRVVAVLSLSEYIAELDRRGREHAKARAAAEHAAGQEPAAEPVAEYAAEPVAEAPAKPRKVELWAKTPDGTWIKRTTANPYTFAVAVKFRDEDHWCVVTFSRNKANAANAARPYAGRGHQVQVVPVLSRDAMLAQMSEDEAPAVPSPAEVEAAAKKDAAKKAIALRTTRNATVAVIPTAAPAAEVDGRTIDFHQTAPGAGHGHVRDAGGARVVEVFAYRNGRAWIVGGVAGAGEWSGSTLAVALKRWARAYGIAAGSATITHDRLGRTRTVAWNGRRNAA